MPDYYAGIGSRETPSEILEAMAIFAKRLNESGMSLRSGHANGADLAFERSIRDVDQHMQIFIPWRGFNNAPTDDPRYIWNQPAWANRSVQKYHPAPEKLSPGAFKLMARNAMQILGPDGKDPVKFVVCWTKDGEASGGTGQAIRMAQDHKITIYNLFESHDYEDLMRRCLVAELRHNRA